MAGSVIIVNIEHKMKKIDIMRGFIVIIVLLTTSINGQEVEDESDFDYIRGSERGPERWGFLHPEWADCSNGNLQSPIDLFNPRVKLVPVTQKIQFFYNPSSATIKNRGHDIEVKWAEEASKIRINDVEYVLTQCHWHGPSEHTIRGRRFDMELHLVHQNPNTKKIAVIGLLYRLGEPDEFLSTLMGQISAVNNSSKEIEAGVINPVDIMKGRGRRYFRYVGSLTTPPCTEGVIWTLDTKIGTVSREQIELLHEAVHDHAEQNARPLQRRNGREIRLLEDPNSPFKCEG